MSDKVLYCEVVCNYFNNLKGYMEDYEIKNLLWCVFGLESENIKDELITSEVVEKFNSCVMCDKGNDLYEELYFLYKDMKENHTI